MRTRIVAAMLIGWAVPAASQQPTGQVRARQIAAAFDKHKSVTKRRRDVTLEKYKDVRAEPVVLQNTRGYAGTYEASDLGSVIIIRVGGDGSLRLDGHDAGPAPRFFTLHDARIDGALLTATKVYRDGASERFEGVFMNRTERTSPSDSGVTTFGLGVVLARPITLSGMTMDKLFYQLKP